ncbi:MAG TPA: FAD-dependent tricarballylate dehydrogenase TcuA, partial [Thermoplasmataceae archaeon]|nr:FAD-dependent tricarballylate dehydrogenase TcuA [Thermoplasmataceae archaeon]
ADVERITQGYTTREILEKVVTESEHLPQWMNEHGVLLHHAVRGAFHYTQANAFIMGGGKQLVNIYYHNLEKLGVKILYETCVESISLDDGLVTLRITKGNSKGVVNASSAVIASGGYEANLEWLKEGYGSAIDNSVVRGNRYNDGIPLKSLFQLGADQVGEPNQAHWTAVDGRAPKFDGGFVTRIDLIPLGIVVNNRGKRFYDEGEDLWTKRYVLWGHLVRDQPDQIAFVIIDSKMLGETLMPMYKPYSGNSLEELATKLGIDPSQLVHTVSEFNDHIPNYTKYDLSKLDACSTVGIEPKKSNWSRKLDRPPFYAWPLRPGITFTYLSARINTRSQVLKKGGGVFENLFAAGELTSGNVYGRGYVGGTGLVIGSVTGITAGREAMISA